MSGRPRQIDRSGYEAGTEIINVRMTRSQKERAKALAQSLDLTMGDLVRKALECYKQELVKQGKMRR